MFDVSAKFWEAATCRKSGNLSEQMSFFSIAYGGMIKPCLNLSLVHREKQRDTPSIGKKFSCALKRESQWKTWPFLAHSFALECVCDWIASLAFRPGERRGDTKP